MEYELYSEVPEKEMRLISGDNLKERVKRDSIELLVIKDGKYDHIIHHPYNEIDGDAIYKIYEYEYVAGSGIVYPKICIYGKIDNHCSCCFREEAGEDCMCSLKENYLKGICPYVFEKTNCRYMTREGCSIIDMKYCPLLKYNINVLIRSWR